MGSRMCQSVFWADYDKFPTQTLWINKRRLPHLNFSSHALPDSNVLTWTPSAAVSSCPCSSSSVNGAVLQPAWSHAEPEGAAGGEDQNDWGQHSAAAGRAAADPGGAAEGAGTESAGETEESPSCSPFYTAGQCRFNAFLMCLAGLFKQHRCGPGGPSCTTNNLPVEV